MRSTWVAAAVVWGFLAAAACAGASYPAGYWEVQGNDRVPLIRQLIEENGWGWRAGPTTVSNLTDGQKRALLPKVPEAWPPDLERRGLLAEPKQELPPMFDWRNRLAVTDIRDQGNCGSCWIFSTVAAVESQVLIHDEETLDLSEQQLLSCVAYGLGCQNIFLDQIRDHLIQYGAVEEPCMPYQADHWIACTEEECEVAVRLDGTYAVEWDVAAIKNAIYTLGPVTVSMSVVDEIFAYQGGCYDITPGPHQGLIHFVEAVGWDDTQCGGEGAWIIKNSWGPGWGMNGFGYVAYSAASIGHRTRACVYSPQLHRLCYDSCVVDADGRGNGNGFLEPGETAGLSVRLVNDGRALASAISGVLRCATPGVTVTDGTAEFPDIPSESSGSTLAPHFEIAIDGSLTDGDWVNFELAITTSTRSATVEFTVYVGVHNHLLLDHFESDAGWTVGSEGDDATDGIWERAIISEKRAQQYVGAVVQPRRDATPYPGCFCYVTGNSPVAAEQTEGDVDGGRTTLLSPLLDLSWCDQAVLSYRRWYSNDTGFPDSEPLEVDVSNDGGSTWVNLETVTTVAPPRRWEPVVLGLGNALALSDRMRVRFVARDEPPFDSVVEAAVDDVEILGFGPLAEATDQAGCDTHLPPARLGLVQNAPNPFSAETVICFDLPWGAQVEMSVYDVCGRKVRQLLSGWMPSGRHSLTWDGREEDGTTLVTGVYFCRLTTPEGAVARRMTLLR